MNIPSAAISLVALLSYSVLLTIILTRNARSRVNISFAYYLVTMIIWSLGALMIYIDARVLDTNLWFRLMLVGNVAMPIAFTIFIQNFLMKDWRVWLIGGGVAYLVALFSIITGSVAVSTDLSSGGQLHVILGSGKYITSAIWFFFVLFSAYNLVHEYRITNDLEFKNRIKWIIGVILLIFCGAATNITPLQVYPVDIAFNAIAAIVIANALLRHHLLDIDVVLHRGILYSIPTAIVGVAYYLILSLVWRAFPNTSNSQIFLISLAVAVMTAVIVQPLKDRAQSWIDRIFFREKYDSKLMLTRVSQSVTSVLDLDQLTQYILDEVTNTLHVAHAGFFLKREETGRYDLMAEKGMELHSNLSLAFTNPIVLYLLRHNHALSRYDINVQPQFRSMWGHEWDEINLIGAELFIPLKAKDELVGIFAVGPKLSEQLYTQDDQLTLITLANQTAVAIENARLYKAEQFRREELNALYALTSQLGATDDVGTVLDSTTRHAVESLHVTFAKVLTLEENGEFLCRTTFPARTLSYPLSVGEYEFPAARQYYQKVILQSQSMVLTQKDPSLSKAELAALHLDQIASLCITPLRVGDEAVGLLILGEQRNLTRESFDNDKMRLVNAIAGQAASAL
jgi:GAF domain-containing protein